MVLYGAVAPGTLDYVSFMKVEKTAYLKIRFDWLFSIYMLFVVAVIVRYVWILSQLLRGKEPERGRLDHGELRPVNPASPFSSPSLAIVGLSLLGLPIGHAMIGGSVLYLCLAGLDMGTAAEQLLNGMYTSYVLLAIPLFILAAEFMNTGSITERLLRFCNALVGRFRGGLAHVNVVQSIIFAGMSGSALADAAASGKLMQTMMTQDGKYPASFAAALTAASSVIGPIIPPSIPLVIYALVSDTSVGYLFLGGVVPGLLLGIAQMGLIAVIAKRRNFPVEPPIPLRELPRITWEALPALMMPVVLLGGIYSGVTTPTEAAAVAAAYALLVSAAALSQHRLARPLPVAAQQRAHDRVDRHADRRRHRLQLRRHGGEHPQDAQPRAARRRVLAAGLPAGRQRPPAGPRLLPGRDHDPPDHRAGAAARPRRRWASTRCISAWSWSSTS